MAFSKISGMIERSIFDKIQRNPKVFDFMKQIVLQILSGVATAGIILFAALALGLSVPKAFGILGGSLVIYALSRIIGSFLNQRAWWAKIQGNKSWLSGEQVSLVVLLVIALVVVSRLHSDVPAKKESVSAPAVSAVPTAAPTPTPEPTPEPTPDTAAPEEIPQALLDFKKTYPETSEFVNNYPNRKHYDTIDITDDVENGTIPLFLQWDERWGYETYGNNFLAVNGCGPTCLSMVVCGLTGSTEWNPLAMAQFSETQGYYLPGHGTSWALMSSGAQTLGLNISYLPISADAIRQALTNGQPLICSVVPGDFTYVGHFIVLTGLDNEGRVLLNDPNSPLHSAKHWEMDTLLPQISQIWAYSAA